MLETADAPIDTTDQDVTPRPPSAKDRKEIKRLADEIASLFAQETLLCRERFARLRRFDELGGWALQGARTCAHWLSWRLGIDLQTAREHVRVARRLGETPELDEAFQRGELSYSKVRAITRVATPRNESRLVEIGRHASSLKLDEVCRGLQPVLDGPADDLLASPSERRRLHVRHLPSGLVDISARVRPEEASIIIAGIDETLARMNAPSRSPAAGEVASSSAEEPPDQVSTVESSSAEEPPDQVSTVEGSSAEEPPDQVSTVEGSSAEEPFARVDAFVAAFEGLLASPPPGSVPGRHEVVLYVDARTGTGELPGGARVSPETVRRLCCDSPIVTLVERAVERGKPRSFDVGRRTRGVPTRLRRLLEARDRTCCFPGCNYRRWLDAHHIEHWADGGATTLENLALNCRRHHRLVHEGGFTMKMTPDGPVFFDPLGRRVEAAPSLPNLGPRALDVLDAVREARGIGPWTNRPRWRPMYVRDLAESVRRDSALVSYTDEPSSESEPAPT